MYIYIYIYIYSHKFIFTYCLHSCLPILQNMAPVWKFESGKMGTTLEIISFASRRSTWAFLVQKIYHVCKLLYSGIGSVSISRNLRKHQFFFILSLMKCACLIVSTTVQTHTFTLLTKCGFPSARANNVNQTDPPSTKLNRSLHRSSWRA